MVDTLERDHTVGLRRKDLHIFTGQFKIECRATFEQTTQEYYHFGVGVDGINVIQHGQKKLCGEKGYKLSFHTSLEVAPQHSRTHGKKKRGGSVKELPQMHLLHPPSTEASES